MIRKAFTLFIIFFSINLSLADSPITSTDIYKAYTDIEMVKYAKKHLKMDEKIANYLHSADVSLDIKAAVINAVGWSVDGMNSAEKYSQYIFSSSLKELNTDTLSTDDLFCLGYLRVLDDYFHPKLALPYITKARDMNNKSFTVAIIYALIQAQIIMNDEGSWCDMWDVVYKVYDDKSVYNDMREDARKIIRDYMVLYKCDKNK